MWSKHKSNDKDNSDPLNHDSETKSDTNCDDEIPTTLIVPQLKQSDSDKDSRLSCPAQTDEQSIRLRSASRDSSVNDDPRSLIDSISGASGRQIWNGKDLAEDDPSISSIKGDSVSATIADYNRKHHAQGFEDYHLRQSAKLEIGGESSQRNNDDLSSNINFYAVGGSTSGINTNQSNTSSSKQADFASVSSNVNLDAFDIIEESSNISSGEDVSQPTLKTKHPHNRTKHRPHKQPRTRNQALLEQALEIDDLPQVTSIYQIEPIIIRGNGNLTLFGLSNSFAAEFPSALIGRISREEFDRTMRRINSLLKDQQSLSAKMLLFGSLCCCCSLGFSLVWPSIALRKRSKMSLQKFLSSENSRLYSKLGLTWKLAEQRCYSNHAFVEYVLMIEFTPKINLYLPD